MFLKVVNLVSSGIRMASEVWHSFSACALFLMTIFYMAASLQRAEDDVTPRLSFVYGKNNTLTQIH